jgi:RND family efflux transporter MFP subunit
MSRPQAWSAFIETLVTILKKSGSVFLVAALAIFGFFGAHYLIPQGDADSQSSQISAVSTTVTLTADKRTAAKLHLSEVCESDFQPTREVPASIRYDATRHVALRSPVDCLVESVAVSLGQQVAQGELLATLTAPQIGTVRSRVQSSQAELEITRIEWDWVEKTHANLIELLQRLDANVDVSALELQFKDRPLGMHRDELLTSYAEYFNTLRIADRSDGLESQGLLAGKTADERRQRLQTAAAKFTSIKEQARFGADQGLKAAKAKLQAAQRAHEVAIEELRVLTGTLAETAKKLPTPETNQLSSYSLVSPIVGIVVQLDTSASSRFQAGETILAIADTSLVWVEAQISQRDWSALDVVDGQTITVSVPALDHASFQAKVKFTGSTVSQTTLSIPLVAELDNSQKIFRPGMFVIARVPICQSRRSLVVPQAALQRDESHEFVFVEVDHNTFRRVDVIAGESSAGLVEIKQGLSVGDRVVDQGAFFLKSELLLEGEE